MVGLAHKAWLTGILANISVMSNPYVIMHVLVLFSTSAILWGRPL